MLLFINQNYLNITKNKRFLKTDLMQKKILHKR